MTISHHDHQPSYLSAFIPFIHDANLPSVIMTISHHTYHPSCNSSMMPICHQTPPLSPLPLCLSAIMSISHPPSASQKSCPSAIIPKSHYANQPPCPPPSANMPITHHLPLKNYAHQPSYLKAIMPISHHAPPPFSLSSKSATMIPPLPSPIIFIGHHANQPPCPYPLFHYSNQLSRAFNITNHLPS